MHQRYQARAHERLTEQMLRRDLAQAQRRAHHTSPSSPSRDEAKQARAFLRRLAGRRG